MGQMAPKKTWLKPELLVLVRNNPEESVLFACKGGSADGAVGGFGMCFAYLLPGCANCNGNVDS
jgi:hypothetical protein